MPCGRDHCGPKDSRPLGRTATARSMGVSTPNVSSSASSGVRSLALGLGSSLSGYADARNPAPCRCHTRLRHTPPPSPGRNGTLAATAMCAGDMEWADSDCAKLRGNYPEYPSALSTHTVSNVGVDVHLYARTPHLLDTRLRCAAHSTRLIAVRTCCTARASTILSVMCCGKVRASRRRAPSAAARPAAGARNPWCVHRTPQPPCRLKRRSAVVELS
jgi:hypothetical protein